MRRALLLIAGTIAGLLLLLSFKSSTAAGSQAAGSQTPSPAAHSAPQAVATVEVAGKVVPTLRGPVQVEVTLSGGTIKEVTVVRRVPGRPAFHGAARSALATLIGETLATQGTYISEVPGAASLSTGFITSLRSALRRSLREAWAPGHQAGPGPQAGHVLGGARSRGQPRRARHRGQHGQHGQHGDSRAGHNAGTADPAAQSRLAGQHDGRGTAGRPHGKGAARRQPGYRDAGGTRRGSARGTPGG